jgi:hypothetical protein
MSPYAHANKEQLVDTTRTLGSTITVTNKLLANSDEQQVLMKEVLGLSSNSPDWDKRLAHYWNSISEDIEVGGRELEVGYNYDVTSIDKKKYVDAFNTNLKEDEKIKTDKDIKKFFDDSYSMIIKDFENSVSASRKLNAADADKVMVNAYKYKYDRIITLEGQKYKFGTPINIADYILYRLCLLHSHVANEYALADKSENITFYLHSEAEIKAFKEEKVRLEKDRMNVFLSVVASPEKVENLLYALELITNAKTDASDRNILLNEFSIREPKKFISMANNSNLQTIGKIEKYIKFGILRRLEGSHIIVDGVDSSKTIGNNIDETINYFTNDSNKPVLSDLTARFNGLPKQ